MYYVLVEGSYNVGDVVLRSPIRGGSVDTLRDTTTVGVRPYRLRYGPGFYGIWGTSNGVGGTVSEYGSEGDPVSRRRQWSISFLLPFCAPLTHDGSGGSPSLVRRF